MAEIKKILTFFITRNDSPAISLSRDGRAVTVCLLEEMPAYLSV